MNAAGSCGRAVRITRSQILRPDPMDASAGVRHDQIVAGGECIAIIPVCHAVALANFAPSADCIKVDEPMPVVGARADNTLPHSTTPCNEALGWLGVDPPQGEYVQATPRVTNLCRCAAHFPHLLDLSNTESVSALFELWLDGRIHLYDRPECAGPLPSEIGRSPGLATATLLD